MKKKILMYMCEKCGTWYTTFPSICPVCKCRASELFEIKVKSLGKNEEAEEDTEIKEEYCYIRKIINDEEEVNGLHIGDIAVYRESDDKIISNSKTIFILCNRCEKKEHSGIFKNNIFRCCFISDDGDVCHGLDALGKVIKGLPDRVSNKTEEEVKK